MATKNINIIVKTINNATSGIKSVWKDLENFAKKHRESFTALSVVWTATFWWLAYWIKQSINEAVLLENSFNWLKSIAIWTWKDFNKTQEFITSFTSDWLVPMADAATSLKNLFARGFSLEESTQLMNAFKDSASFWRQASLSLWEAVRSATEWLKNENSILVDNAWVTKNVSKMWEEYSKNIWISVNELTN